MRPLGFGEIFDVAIKIFWKNAGTLLAVVAVVIVPMQIISNLIIVSTLPDPDLLGGSVFQPATPTQPTGLVDGDDVALMFAGVAVAALFSLIATALATGASYKAVGDAYLGEKPNWKTSLSYGWRRTHSLVWINLLTLFAIGGIFFAFIFVGGFMGGITGETAVIVITFLLAFLGAAAAAAWIWVSWSVATPALLTEDARGTKALRRSFQLVRGRWWRTFGLLILGYLIVLVVSGIISTIPQIVLLTDVGDSTVASLVIGGVGSALASILTTPFLAALVTVVYFDLRVNKEGFDLQLLAQRIGVTPPTELPAGLQPPAPPGWPPPASPGQPGWGPPPPGPSAPGWGPPPQQWAPPPQGPPGPGWGYPAPGPPAPGWQPPPPSPEPGPPEQPPPPDEK